VLLGRDQPVKRGDRRGDAIRTRADPRRDRALSARTVATARTVRVALAARTVNVPGKPSMST
jgi:hypothetical protein